MKDDQPKAKSKSISLRPDQEATVNRILDDLKVKRSHYLQLLVDRDLATDKSGKPYSRALADRTAPSDDRLARLERVLELGEKFFRENREK